MNEQHVYRVMMVAFLSMAVASGIGTLVLLALLATEGFRMLVPMILLAIIALVCCGVVAFFGEHYKERRKVFANEIEQEVLNRRQRQELREARGRVVMQRALQEIQKEEENIVHRQIEAANDPEKPPHETRFGDDDRLGF